MATKKEARPSFGGGSTPSTDQPVINHTTVNNQQPEAEDPNVIAIRNNMDSIAALPDILIKNGQRVKMAIAIGMDIWAEIDQTESGGGVMTEQQYEDAKMFIMKAATAKTEMMALRSPGTQAFDLIRTMFTALEKQVDMANKDSIVFKLQSKNNSYVTRIEAEKEQKRKEQEKEIAKSSEAAVIKSNFFQQIGVQLAAYITSRKTLCLDSFNKITLDDYEAKSTAIRAMATAFPGDKPIASIINIQPPHVIYHNTDQVGEVFNAVWDEYDFDKWKLQYGNEMQNQKTELISMLPAKLEELKKLEAAGKAEKKRLEEEKKKREQEQSNKLLEEQRLQQLSVTNTAEAMKDAEQLQTLFNTDTTLSSTNVTSKKSFIMEVKNHAGVSEVIALWFKLFAKEWTVDELIKKLSFMITDLQKEANKPGGGQRIAGENVAYSLETKSVNRKVLEA